MRPFPLSELKTGIQRMRWKGGARADSLYDLINGYIDEAGSPRSRPGSYTAVTLPSNTVGLTTFLGRLHTFSTEPQVSADPRVVINVIKHPEDPDAQLTRIHFAEPYMGFLYVAAEFDDGLVQHYWLQRGDDWVPNKVYMIGDLVHASTDNGLVYEASRIDEPAAAWEPGVARAVGDVVEPTVFNGYRYTVVEINGANPASGTIEPAWPTSDGAKVVESTNDAPESTGEGGSDSGGGGKYDNPGGSAPGGGGSSRGSNNPTQAF